MKSYILRLMSLLFLVASLASPSVESASAETLTWKFTNGTTTRSKIEIKFFSQNRDFVWPSKSTVWPLTNQNPLSMTLQCSRGEKICYGANAPGTTSTWGSGIDGKARCDACCYLCDNTTVTKNLTGTPVPKAMGR